MQPHKAVGCKRVNKAIEPTYVLRRRSFFEPCWKSFVASRVTGAKSYTLHKASGLVGWLFIHFRVVEMGLAVCCEVWAWRAANHGKSCASDRPNAAEAQRGTHSLSADGICQRSRADSSHQQIHPCLSREVSISHFQRRLQNWGRTRRRRAAFQHFPRVVEESTGPPPGR